MASPIVQKLRHVNHIPGPVRQTQYHIVILTAVKPGTEQLCSIQQLSGKNAEMTDVIICPQIVDGIIRLEVQGNHPVDVPAFEGGLITIDIVRILFIDHLYIFIKGTGMENIVMIKEADIFSCGQGKALIRVAGNALVFYKLFVADRRPGVCLPSGPYFGLHLQASLVFLHHLSHIGMIPVGAVRQAELPVFIGLIHNGIDHLPQEILRRVVKRHQNTDFHHPLKALLPLGFGLLRGGEAFGSVILPCL